MADVIHISNLWETVVIPSVLEQYKESSKWLAVLKSVIDKFQYIEDAVAELPSLLDFSSIPSGLQLDWLAGLINVTRIFGETDNAFYQRFVAECSLRNAGTPNNVIYNVSVVTGDNVPQFLDEAPATFFIYDGYRYDDGIWTAGGNQAYKKQVQKTAPAGVLGLVGAGVALADGTLLGSYSDTETDRKIILAVASDENVERSMVLADNDNRVIISGQSVPVSVNVKGVEVPTRTITTSRGDITTVRIKDLPNSENEDSYLVKDNETNGTTKVHEEDFGMHTRKAGTNTLQFYRGKKQSDEE